MVYSINLLLCAISALLFKNVFTFLALLIGAYILFYFFIRKMSNTTILLYFLNLFVLFVGAFVIWLLPNKEGIIPSIIVDAYYLGPLECFLFILFLISIACDITYLIHNKKNKKKVVKKEVSKEKEKKNKEFKEKVEKLEKTINEKNEKIKKIVENKKEEKPKKKKTVKHTVKKEKKK